jgi:hypothetical protein
LDRVVTHELVHCQCGTAAGARVAQRRTCHLPGRQRPRLGPRRTPLGHRVVRAMVATSVAHVVRMGSPGELSGCRAVRRARA